MSGVKRQKVFWDDGGETIKRFHEVDAVLASDYDRLEQELRDIKDSMAYRGSLLGRTEAERDELRARVEAMRRLLADEHLCGALTIICQLGVVERCRCWSCRMKRIDAALQTNP